MKMLTILFLIADVRKIAARINRLPKTPKRQNTNAVMAPTIVPKRLGIR